MLVDGPDTSAEWEVRRYGPFGLERIVRRFLCWIGWHEDFKWSIARCRRAHVFSGVFAPTECALCGKRSQVFPIPPMPEEHVVSRYVDGKRNTVYETRWWGR